MHTQIMGILNVTTDSFYDGGRYQKLDQALERAHQMQEEGADWIDIGGCSSRPNADPIPVEVEIQRTLPLIRILKKELKIPLSIDTVQFEVARAAVDEGVDFLNDVSGFSDPRMRALAQSSGLPLCVMHRQGSAKTMQVNPSYPEGVLFEICSWFQKQIHSLLELGIPKEKIYLDPGIGFGKTVEHNLQILQDLQRLRELGCPLLLGTSRKTFIQKLTGQSAENALYGTLGVNSLLIEQGVDMLRVHDVLPHQDLIRMIRAVQKASLSVR